MSDMFDDERGVPNSGTHDAIDIEDDDKKGYETETSCSESDYLSILTDRMIGLPRALKRIVRAAQHRRSSK